jgi:hypothetical protein
LKLLYACAFVIASCETERIIFEGPYYVRFTEDAATRRESYSKVIDIPIHVAGPAPAEDLVVNYTIGGNAREGVDYTIVGERGKAIIPKGKLVGAIKIQLINNSNNIIRSQEIDLSLLSISDPTYQIGQGKSAIGRNFTYTIFDDCILGGNYKGTTSPFAVPTEGITVTSEDCETYLLSNWNIGIFNSPFEFDLTFVDNGDNTLTIPSQEEDFLPEELATIEGQGIVDPVTRRIELTVVLIDFEEQPEITFTLIPD